MRWLLLPLLAVAAVCAGCGGGDEAEDARVALPPALAEELAGRSDAVAELLARGEACAAGEEVRALRRATEVAIADGRVPDELRAELVGAIERIEAGVVCESPEPPAAGEAPPPAEEPADPGDAEPEPPAEEEVEPEPDVDPCEELELRLEAVEEQLDRLDEIEDRDERRRQRDALREERRAVRDELRECEQERD